MAKERVLITVKTYPTLSRKYGETVCTAGLREDGSWVRIYPVPFRRLDETDRYKKFDWIECNLARNLSDIRPESYSPIDKHELNAKGHMDTENNWSARRKLVLGTARVFDDLQELIAEAKGNVRSLAVFKPARITDFVWEEDGRDWDPNKLAAMRQHLMQGELFEEGEWRNTFTVIPKLPYAFSYRFEDAGGKKSELQVLDWETGALFWNCLRDSEGDEEAALGKVKQKYFDQFCRKDLHFFLGTTQQFHQFAPNPWVIIGLFPIPHENQMELF